MSQPQVVFLALARDCAATLPGFLAFSRALGASGVPNIVIVGENGSRDGTRAIVVEAAAAGGVWLENTAFLAKIDNRYRRLAEGREHLKAVLDRSGLNPRFACVVDVDSAMAEPPSVAGFVAALELLTHRPDLFAFGATSRPHFYDLIAYEDSMVSYADLPVRVTAARKSPLAYHRFVAREIYAHLPGLTRDSELICVSSFNGLCVYRYDLYRGGSYVSSAGDEICEHVTINRSIARSSGRVMAVTPLLVLRTPPDHAPKGIASFWWERGRRLLARLVSREPASTA